MATKSGLPEEELQRYRDTGCVIELRPGDVLFEQGTEPDEMYVILRGTLAITMDGVQVAEVSEGQVIGEKAFFLGENRSATARALTVCELHAISPQKVRMLMQHPLVVLMLMRLYSRWVESANQALLVRTQTSQNDRMALEEEQRQRAEDKKAFATKLSEAETRVAAALANLKASDDRITLLERILRDQNLEVGTDGAVRRTFPRPIDLAPPPEEAAPIALVAVKPPPPVAPVPVGRRTQNMVAFDPKTPLKQIVIGSPKKK